MSNENTPLRDIEKRQEETQAKLEDEFQERMKQEEQRRSNLESERIRKVTGSGLNEDAYAIREIILMVKRAPNQEFFQPSLLQLGFTNTIDAMGEAQRLFQTLQGKGCFKKVERTGNDHFTIRGPNTHFLKKELRALKQLELGFLEKFFRGVSRGLIGVNQILVTLATLLAIVTGLLSIKTNNQNQELKDLQKSQKICQESLQKLQPQQK